MSIGSIRREPDHFFSGALSIAVHAPVPSLEIPWRISRVGSDIYPDMSDTDLELLARYTRQHAEDAFAEVVPMRCGNAI